jgi:hypothetical protein
MRKAPFVWLILLMGSVVHAQTQPPSDPQAVAFANQAIAALSGGLTINDVTLTGTATWSGTGTSDTGAATLRALGTGESRMDLALTAGTRTEIRDAQTGNLLGQWFNPDNTSGYMAAQNCMTDAVWFFPVLGSLTAGSNVVLLYIGQETRNGTAVQHVQSYVYQPNPPATVPTPQQLSTMDFYLDAGTLLPVAITFNGHPDNDASINLLNEVDFSNYQPTNGALVPLQMQKYQQGGVWKSIVSNLTKRELSRRRQFFWERRCGDALVPQISRCLRLAGSGMSRIFIHGTLRWASMRFTFNVHGTLQVEKQS